MTLPAGAAAAGEAVVGWRLWRVEDGAAGLELTAWSSAGVAWPARRRAEARCLLEMPAAHVAPEPGCRCGLYAFARREDAEAALAAEMLPTTCALGQVSLWGRTVRHAAGWRAEFAYPYHVWILDGTPELVRELRSTYLIDADAQPTVELLARVRGERRRRHAERTAAR